jgi:gamma-butyrobetaine dioxygenase
MLQTTDGIAGADMLDLAPYPTQKKIIAVESDARKLVLTWSDGRKSDFHALWLRDNCACPLCRHPQALERRYLLLDQAAPVLIAEAALTTAGDLAITFTPDDSGARHRSAFAAGWLRHHDYNDAARHERHAVPALWHESNLRELPAFDYDSVMTTERGLYDWLAAWRKWGAALLRNAPAQPGEVLRIAARVGPLRPTNFGTHYDVLTMPNPNASAYTAMALEPHTDLANWQSPPDCQFLFCIANETVGGMSILVDGYGVAEKIRVENPAAFNLLSAREIDFRFHDETCDIRRRARMIDLHADGSIKAVRFNNWLRGTFDLPALDIEPMYDALRVMWREMRNPDLYLRPRLEAGDMFILDNYRILHGRDAFDPNTGRRHLQGCYVDRDFVLSRIRVLERTIVK